MRRWIRSHRANLVLAVAALAAVAASADDLGQWRRPPPDRCPEPRPATASAQAAVATAAQWFDEGSGEAAIMELETWLVENPAESPVQFILAQFYLLAAQGRQGVMPREGPAAATGRRDEDRTRWLARADSLLTDAAALRPADGAIEYLRAEVARERGDVDAAAAIELAAQRKCSFGDSMETIRRCQRAAFHAARPIHPLTAVLPLDLHGRRGRGLVDLDLLIDPEGRVQDLIVLRGGEDLAAAAAAIARDAGYQAARVGLYPVWSWMTVSVEFRAR